MLSRRTLCALLCTLPLAAPGMIARVGPVTQVQSTGSIDANAYRSPLVPAINTNGLSVQAAGLGLPATVGTTIVAGRYLNGATAQLPVVVLGAAAAQRLGIGRLHPGERIWLGGRWFYLAGILAPAKLAPEIDNSILVGFPAAERYRTPLASIACPMAEVPVAAPDEPLVSLLPRLGRATDGRGLVLDEGALVGIVSPADVARAIDRATLASARP